MEFESVVVNFSDGTTKEYTGGQLYLIDEEGEMIAVVGSMEAYDYMRAAGISVMTVLNASRELLNNDKETKILMKEKNKQPEIVSRKKAFGLIKKLEELFQKVLGITYISLEKYALEEEGKP